MIRDLLQKRLASAFFNFMVRGRGVSDREFLERSVYLLMRTNEIARWDLMFSQVCACSGGVRYLKCPRFFLGSRYLCFQDPSAGVVSLVSHLFGVVVGISRGGGLSQVVGILSVDTPLTKGTDI